MRWERLQREAARSGGALHVLNGNHETMNVAQDMRYGTLGASQGLARMLDIQRLGRGLKQRCKCQAGWTDVPASPAPSALCSGHFKRVYHYAFRFVNLQHSCCTTEVYAPQCLGHSHCFPTFCS